MSDRRSARILAMQALCQLEVLGGDSLLQLDGFLLDEAEEAEIRDYAGRLAREAASNLAALDESIESVSEHWSLKRMAMVDRNVLRVAVCELLRHPDVPPAVVINEAVDIGKTFGTADSGSFINGILDAIAKRQAAAATSSMPAEAQASETDADPTPA